jgi:hypothetical protein
MGDLAVPKKKRQMALRRYPTTYRKSQLASRVDKTG